MANGQIITRRSMLFRSLYLGAGALAMALGCSSGVKQASSANSAQKVQLPPAKPVRSHYSSFKNAVSTLIAKGPRVLSFGEIHKREHTNLVSTLSRFSRQALPLLYSDGYKDYICEFLPGDQEMGAEVEHYLLTGEIKPYLKESFDRHTDCGGVMEFLNAIRGLAGARIYGSNLSKQEREHMIFLEKEAELINRKTLEMIALLLAQNKKIVVYSGIQHNNLEPLPGEEAFSFGQTLREELGEDFVEVDLLLGELIHKIGPKNIGIEGLEAPQAGIDLYTFKNGRKVLVFPLAGAQIDPIPPLPIENCILP